MTAQMLRLIYSACVVLIITIIISILEPVFLYQGLGFLTSLPRNLSTQNDSEGQQSPYLASFCHSLSLHPMISLACQIFSVQPHSACILLKIQPVLRSTCPNHLILLVRSTTSKSWMPSLNDSIIQLHLL